MAAGRSMATLVLGLGLCAASAAGEAAGPTLGAQEAYAAALAYAAEHPEDPRGAVARLDHVLRTWPDAPRAEDARERLKSARAAWDRLARAELDAREEAAKKEADRGDYEAAAEALLSFPENLLSDAAAAELKAALEPYLEADRKAKEALRQRRLVESSLWRRLFPLVNARAYDAALAAAQAFAKENAGEEAAQATDAAAATLAAAGDFWKAVLQGLPAAPGRQVKIQGALWRIVGLDGEKAILRSGDFERRMSPLDFPVLDAASLAKWAGKPARLHFALACLCAFDTEWKAAELQAVEAETRDRLAVLDLIDVLRLGRARALLDQAREAVDAGRKGVARSALRELLEDYREVDLIEENLAWINAALARFAAEDEARSRPPAPPPDEPRFRLCPRCLGTGKIDVARWRNNGMIREQIIVSRRCPVCGGRGKLPWD